MPPLGTDPLRLAAIGCGARTRTYLRLAARQPGRYTIVAAADPDETRLANVAAASGNPGFRSFRDDKAILAEPQLADVMIIGTQDALHAEHAVAAMERGYHLLLEKPIAPDPLDVERIRQTADRLRRRVVVCHVLRYTPLYRTIKGMLADGCIGELITLNAVEGVDPWHHAHSFVRGHWSDTRRSSPMILAKSCHDLDLIRWIAGAPCSRIASFGSNTYFHPSSSPEGAPSRCTDGCPAESRCLYNARRYLGDQGRWLGHVMNGSETASPAERERWLAESPWSRCVYQCGNDTVDHQVVNMAFASGVTATFTMTAFDSGRSIQIFGTEGRLRAGESVHRDTGKWIVLEGHDGSRQLVGLDLAGEGHGGHLGGDEGLVDALYGEMTGPEESMTSPLEESVESHRMAFAAEQSRLAGSLVHL